MQVRCDAGEPIGHVPIKGMFMPPANLLSISSTSPYTATSVRMLSVPDMYSKAQHDMFARRSLADTFKCDKQLRTNSYND